MNKYIEHIVISLTIILAFACKSNTPNSHKAIFRMNESKGISTLDPAFAGDERIIRPVTQVFNGLIELDDSLKAKPLIAKQWTISDDALHYTFTIRNDVYFHDNELFKKAKGRKVTAHDFQYSFERIKNRKTASSGAWVFNYTDSLKPFEAINDSVFRVNLRKPFAAFLSLLSMPYCCVVPREIVEYYGNDFRSHPVGTGPFMLKTWREGEKLVLIKNPNYFERDSKGQQLPYIDGISITFIKDKQAEFLEFAKGNIDYLDGLNPAYNNELLTRNGKLSPKYTRKFKLDICPYLNTEYLGCVVDPKISNSPVTLKKIRLAINYGLDRAKMIKYLRKNLYTPAYWGIVPQGIPGYSTKAGSYEYNPDKARKLLTEAGFQNGVGLPEITLTASSDYLDLCEFIQHDLSQIGIKIKVETSTGASFREMVANAKLPFFRNSWFADYPDAENYLALFYSPNFSPNGANYTHFKSTEFDSLYNIAVSLPDENKRFDLYRQMSQIIIENAPVIPIYYGSAIRFYSKKITGFNGNPLNTLKLKRINFEQ